MISHKYRCIMIHIPRTGGSSIERWLHGGDWWSVSPHTKHLLASQAKQVYAAYWDDYFKFAFVRNPWDRMVSCLHYASHFGFPEQEREKRSRYAPPEMIQLDGYKQLFGSPVTLEHDHRFYDRDDLLRKSHRANQVYLNILDEPIDFIGRFENLRKDTAYIRQQIGVEKPFKAHVQRSKRREYDRYYDERSREDLRELFQHDIDTFGYKFQRTTRRLLARLRRTA